MNNVPEDADQEGMACQVVGPGAVVVVEAIVALGLAFAVQWNFVELSEPSFAPSTIWTLRPAPRYLGQKYCLKLRTASSCLSQAFQMQLPGMAGAVRSALELSEVLSVAGSLEKAQDSRDSSNRHENQLAAEPVLNPDWHD
jgi:hypothetical protein